jgi:hypothetical protein
LSRRVLGGPATLSVIEGGEIMRFVQQAWPAQFGRPLGALTADLRQARDLFDPVARGGRLRERLHSIPGLSAPRPDTLDDVAVLSLDRDRHVVTPEGRGLYAILEAISGDVDGLLHIDTPDAHAIEREVAAVIREWSRHRLIDVISKQRGEGPPMHPAAAAMVLLLLINGSISPETAVQRIDKTSQLRFDESLARIIAAFADVARPSDTRSNTEFRMYGGWHLSEARRRLPGALVVDDDGHVYVRADEVDRVADFVVRDLKRAAIDPATRSAAFEALVHAYRRELRSLTAMGSGFERVTIVDEIRRRLAEQ